MSGSPQDPKRLFDAGGSDLRALLAAGKSEVPDAAQMMALAAKLGAAGAVGAGAAGAGAKAASALKAALALKVLGVIAVVGVAGTTAVVVARRSTPETPSAPVGLVATPTATQAPAAPMLPTETPSSLETAAPSAAAPRQPAPTASVAPGESEEKLLERAQDALRANPNEALAICNEHAKRFPNGSLAQEREVIAIEALVKTGRNAEARKRADRFESRYPGSTHARRLETLLAE